MSSRSLYCTTPIQGAHSRRGWEGDLPGPSRPEREGEEAASVGRSVEKGRSGVWPLELRRGGHDRSPAGLQAASRGVCVRASSPSRKVCEQLALESQIFTGKNYAGIWVPGTPASPGCLDLVGLVLLAAAQASGYGTTQLCTIRPAAKVMRRVVSVFDAFCTASCLHDLG